jgi:hypothetical protein
VSSDVSLAFNAVGRDRGVNSLLTRTASNVRAANLRSAAATIAMGGAMASAAAHAVALGSSSMAAAGAIAMVPAALAGVAAAVGAARAVTFGLGAAWKATGVQATGGGGAASGAAKRVASAQREVKAATQALADAQRDAADAQEAVTRAREEETERLADLATAAAGARLDEEAAVRAVAKAEQDLAVARATGGYDDEIDAELALRQSKQTLTEVRDRVQDLGEEQADGAKKGVEGSDAVQEALERQADAQRQAQQAAERLADAQDAVKQSAAGAASGGFDPAAAALARLSPNGRAVILMLRQLAPAWEGAARAGQQKTFAGVAGDLKDLSGKYLPMATSWLTRMGGSFNVAIRQSLGLFKTKAAMRDVGIFTDNVASSTDKLARAVRPVINGILQWVTLGSNFLPGMAGSTLTIAQRFERWSIEMRKSGQATSWIKTGITTLKSFASVAGDVVMSVVAIFRAGGDGGSTLNSLKTGAAAMRQFLESAEGQEKVKEVMTTLRSILSGVGQALTAVAGHGDEFNTALDVTGGAVSFVVDNLDTLAGWLPAIAAGFVLWKVAQFGANVAAVASLPITAGQAVAQWRLGSAMKANTAALAANAAGTGANTTATGVNTAAQNTGVLARGRAVIGMVAQKVALVATTIATKAAAAGQWILNAAMSANPLGLIVLALVAVAAGLYLLWTRSSTFRRIVTGAFNAVWGGIKVGWEWTKKNWPLLLGILTGPIGWAVLLITKNWAKIKAGAGSVKDWIVGRFTALTSWFSGLPGRIGRALSSIGRFISAPFRAAFNAVASLWNRSVGGMAFTIPGWVPGFGGQSFALPRMPQLAQGGIVRATPGGRIVNIGEGGEDEAVIPLSKLSSTVGAAAGGGTVRVLLDAQGAETEFKRWLRKAIRTDNLLQGATG